MGPTVFMPDHLRTILATKRDDSTGVYFQNCKEVLEGFFGNLEVGSAEGFKRFLEQMDTSYTSGCWRQETEECKKGWKYGTWGEDLFMVPMPWHHYRQAVQLDPGVKGEVAFFSRTGT